MIYNIQIDKSRNILPFKISIRKQLTHICWVGLHWACLGWCNNRFKIQWRIFTDKAWTKKKSNIFLQLLNHRPKTLGSLATTSAAATHQTCFNFLNKQFQKKNCKTNRWPPEATAKSLNKGNRRRSKETRIYIIIYFLG